VGFLSWQLFGSRLKFTQKSEPRSLAIIHVNLNSFLCVLGGLAVKIMHLLRWKNDLTGLEESRVGGKAFPS